MRSLSPLLCVALFAQAGGQPVNIPIANPPAGLGYGQTFSRDLGVTPAELQAIPGRPGYFFEGVYLLEFRQHNSLLSYPGYYRATVTFGTQELCDGSGWGKKLSTKVTIVCGGPGYIVADKSLPGGGPVQGSKNLVFTLTVNDGSANGGWPIVFEDGSFSFTFTPDN